MVIKNQNSFSLVFLATSTLFSFILHVDQGNASDLCAVADYKSLCKATVKDITEPNAAIEASIRSAIQRTRHALILSRRFSQDDSIDTCQESYDDAISDLEESIKNLKSRDKDTLNTNLSGVISYYSTCDDAFEGIDQGPLTRVNSVLEKMVDNALALVTLMH